MLIAILLSWFNYATNQYATEYAVAVIVAGPERLTCRDAIWWAIDPYRTHCYITAAKELGIIESPIDICDLERACGVDYEKAVFEMQWTHARLTKRIDGR